MIDIESAIKNEDFFCCVFDVLWDYGVDASGYVNYRGGDFDVENHARIQAIIIDVIKDILQQVNNCDLSAQKKLQAGETQSEPELLLEIDNADRNFVLNNLVFKGSEEVNMPAIRYPFFGVINK